MRVHATLPAVAVSAVMAAVVVAAPGSAHAGPRAEAGDVKRYPRQAKQSAKFANIWLTTQHGKRVRFYDDLVKDKVVIINMMYTTCVALCPFYQVQLTKLYELLGRWMGKEIVMLSITIDPEVDRPAVLKRYWKAFGAQPGWLFLTGKFADIERLRRDLGVYDLDPVIDADKTQHAGILTIGNDRTDRWLALPIMMHLRQLAMTIVRNTHDRHWRRRTVSRKGMTDE